MLNTIQDREESRGEEKDTVTSTNSLDMLSSLYVVEMSHSLGL